MLSWYLQAQSVLRKYPTSLHQKQQPDPLIQGGMNPCFHVIYIKFWPYHLNVTAENWDSSDQATFLWTSVVRIWWACANCSSVSCSLLTGVARSVMICCCSPPKTTLNHLSLSVWCLVWTSAPFLYAKMHWFTAVWLGDWIFALTCSWAGVPDRVAGECTSAYQWCDSDLETNSCLWHWQCFT